MSKRGLGKGLEALLPSAFLEEGEALLELKPEEIEPNPYQPRRKMDPEKLEELAQSIRAQGLLQPIVVRKKDEKYQVVVGSRRLEAAKKAGLKEVPALVREYSEAEVVEAALVENLQREDINPLEAAQAYRRLTEEFKLTQEDLAKKVGKSRAAVANTLRLLNLPQEIQESLLAGKITEGHARALLMVDKEEQRLFLSRQVEGKGLSVRETERLARALSEGKPLKRRPRQLSPLSPELLEAQESLQRLLGTRVEIRLKSEKEGVLELYFFSLEELGHLIDLLRLKGCPFIRKNVSHET